jgi:hypothetical protein
VALTALEDIMASKPKNKMEPQTLPLPQSTGRGRVQAHAKSGWAKTLLPIYLGKRTSERVLTGQAKRGTGEKIHAVAMRHARLNAVVRVHVN